MVRTTQRFRLMPAVAVLAVIGTVPSARAFPNPQALMAARAAAAARVMTPRPPLIYAPNRLPPPGATAPFLKFPVVPTPAMTAAPSPVVAAAAARAAVPSPALAAAARISPTGRVPTPIPPALNPALHVGPSLPMAPAVAAQLMFGPYWYGSRSINQTVNNMAMNAALAQSAFQASLLSQAAFSTPFPSMAAFGFTGSFWAPTDYVSSLAGSALNPAALATAYANPLYSAPSSGGYGSGGALPVYMIPQPPPPATQQASLNTSAVPAPMPRVDWPLGLRTLAPAPVSQGLQQRIESVMLAGQAGGGVSPELVQQGRSAVTELRQLLASRRTDFAEGTYMDAQNFLNRLDHVLKGMQ